MAAREEMLMMRRVAEAGNRDIKAEVSIITENYNNLGLSYMLIYKWTIQETSSSTHLKL